MNKLLELKTQISDSINEHPEIFSILLLSVLCLFFLFFGINFYPLIDVDETRYAVMARDLINSGNWNILMLNNVPFLEKPPLYFWIVGVSVKIFGDFNEFTVRFPIACLSTFFVFFTFFFAKKIVNRKFAIISAVTLLSSLFFLMLSHVAILDMVLTVFIASTLYCGLLTHFVQEKNKKYCWWCFYLFAGLGCLTKGILGIALPFIIIFIFNLFLDKAKEIFKPAYFGIGLIIFLLIVVPWHFIMCKDFGYFFIQDYFVYHHFSRFVNSEHIGRQRPFLYFIPVFFGGFFPWTIIFISVVVDGIKKLIQNIKNVFNDIKYKDAIIVEEKNSIEKLTLFSWIYFLVVFLVVSISSTKLPPYILPLFPAAAFLTANFWYKNDYAETANKTVKFSTLTIAVIFIIAGLFLSIAKYVIPSELLAYILGFKYFLMLGMPIVGVFLLYTLKTKKTIYIFAGHVMVMAFITVFAVVFLFNLIYSGGQNELIKFSSFTPENKNSKLVTFNFAVKPSVLINHNNVKFITDIDFKTLYSLMDNNNKENIYVITKNKQVKKYDYQSIINERLILLEKGNVYSFYKKKN